MRFISYNILNPYHAVKWNTIEGLKTNTQEDNWDDGRRISVFKNLKQSRFDIACLQEVSKRTLPEFKASFSVAGYFPHMSYDEIESEHGTAILYNPTLFDLVQCKEIIAPTKKQRSATCVDLKSKSTARIIRVLSVHLKGYDPYEEMVEVKRKSQVTGDQELNYYVQGIFEDISQVDEMMIAGDFNEDYQEMIARGMSSRQGILIQKGFVWDETIDVTESRSGRKIDWIFYKNLSSQQVTRLSHVTIAQDRLASDHAITACDLLTL